MVSLLIRDRQRVDPPFGCFFYSVLSEFFLLKDLFICRVLIRQFGSALIRSASLCGQIQLLFVTTSRFFLLLSKRRAKFLPLSIPKAPFLFHFYRNMEILLLLAICLLIKRFFSLLKFKLRFLLTSKSFLYLLFF